MKPYPTRHHTRLPVPTALRGHATRHRRATTLSSHVSRTILLLILATLLPACAAPRNPVPYARLYPASPPRAKTLDIQVFRETHYLELTNTTARAFGPSTIWLNSRYSRPIDGLAVGQTLRLRLTDFRDENYEAFRAGGFFAVDAPEPLVLAELETDDAESGQRVFYGLIVVRAQVE